MTRVNMNALFLSFNPFTHKIASTSHMISLIYSANACNLYVAVILKSGTVCTKLLRIFFILVFQYFLV